MTPFEKLAMAGLAKVYCMPAAAPSFTEAADLTDMPTPITN